MVRRIIKSFFFILLFTAAGSAIYSWARESLRIQSGNTEGGGGVLSLQQYKYSEVPALDILIVQIDEHQPAKRILQCGRSGCAVRPTPRSLSGEALSDGKSWYHYGTAKNSRGQDIVVLQRTWIEESKVDTLVEQTPLVRPRNLYISPDGQKIAYFLDDIDSGKNLTELWMYDAKEEGTRLLAERLVTPDILTSPRWNRSGTMMWFIANSGEAGEEMLEFITVSSGITGATARFKNIDWSGLQESISRGAMDINFSGSMLLYSNDQADGNSELVIIQDGSSPQQQVIRGSIPYIQWLEDDSFLYVVQSEQEFVIWHNQKGEQVPAARVQGMFRSAHADSGGQYVAFITDDLQQETHLNVLELSTGLIREQAAVPAFGQHVHLVRAEQEMLADVATAGITSVLSDAEIIAFLEKNIAQISGQRTAEISRILLTEHDNTAYIDYRVEGEQMRRLLITVQDAVHAEWSVRARYKSGSGAWQKVQGGGFQDPSVTKMYEWEADIRQWILKSELDK